MRGRQALILSALICANAVSAQSCSTMERPMAQSAHVPLGLAARNVLYPVAEETYFKA